MNLAKILIGIATVVIIMVVFPIVDLFQWFLLIVIVPLMFLTAIGVITEGTYELIRKGEYAKVLKERITYYVEEFERQDGPPRASSGEPEQPQL